MIKTKIATLIILMSLLGGGCTSAVADGSTGKIREFWNNTLQPRISVWFSKQQDNAINVLGTTGKNFSKGLTSEQKQKISEWLQTNKLNDYGDPLDTLYTGGTPLFDEAKGISIDRFEYLIEKFPSLMDIISATAQKENTNKK